jgi:multisubunit Na+/H+ antiporter MnhB subunit
MAKCSVPPKVALVLVIAITLVLAVPALGLSFGHPVQADVDQYYLDNTQGGTGSNNAVTAIVFDFRGFDTLGEATVLFVAVLGITMLFRRNH